MIAWAIVITAVAVAVGTAVIIATNFEELIRLFAALLA
jgi:hypothetical protein